MALLAGAMTLFAFAPFSIFPFAILGPALLMLLWLDATPRQALWGGWLYGIGLFGFGVSWVEISIAQFGNIGGLLSTLITLGFILLVAAYYALTGWLAVRLFTRPANVVRVLLVYPPLWVLVEWLRGWILTGFPWLSLGYSQIDSPLAGFAPLLGVYGVSLAVTFTAGLLVALLINRQQTIWIALFLAFAIWVDGFLLLSRSWTEPMGESIRVSLVQPNIPQREKWKGSNLAPTLERFRSLSREHWDSKLIVWPETAVPAFYRDVDNDFLTPLETEALAQGSAILLGLPIWEPEKKHYFNAMLALDGSRESYAKRHLVPFGEFLPFRQWIEPIMRWMNIPLSNFSAGTSSRTLLPVSGIPVGVSICYEDAFATEVADALPEAQLLVNLSNDAWFGDSIALPQHLQIARMRALETGRYMLRSTNTGISAIIDAKGQVQSRSSVEAVAVVTGEVERYQGLTPASRYAQWLPLVLFMLLLVIRLLDQRRVGKRS